MPVFFQLFISQFICLFISQFTRQQSRKTVDDNRTGSLQKQVLFMSDHILVSILFHFMDNVHPCARRRTWEWTRGASPRSNSLCLAQDLAADPRSVPQEHFPVLSTGPGCGPAERPPRSCVVLRCLFFAHVAVAEI